MFSYDFGSGVNTYVWYDTGGDGKVDDGDGFLKLVGVAPTPSRLSLLTPSSDTSHLGYLHCVDRPP